MNEASGTERQTQGTLPIFSVSERIQLTSVASKRNAFEFFAETWLSKSKRFLHEWNGNFMKFQIRNRSLGRK